MWNDNIKPTTNATRASQHKEISAHLTSLGSNAMVDLLANAREGSAGLGSRTIQLQVGETPVFCKLVPLTEIESAVPNLQSTANIFQLPLYYQYGIGSVGFGAWRELAAHALTSSWVLDGGHEQFPLLYHWRVVQLLDADPIDAEAYAYLTHPAGRAYDELAIRQRLDALQAARAHIAIFSEQFPSTLSNWLIEQLQSDQLSARAAVEFVEGMALEAINFMRRQGFVHFDAHLDNILTDGVRLYFADFGLAVHTSFDLTAEERSFLARNYHYDAARFSSSLIHTICRAMPGDEAWGKKLRNAKLQTESLPPSVVAALQRHAPTATYMTAFSRTLITADRHAIFSAPAM